MKEEKQSNPSGETAGHERESDLQEEIMNAILVDFASVSAAATECSDQKQKTDKGKDTGHQTASNPASTCVEGGEVKVQPQPSCDDGEAVSRKRKGRQGRQKWVSRREIKRKRKKVG